MEINAYLEHEESDTPNILLVKNLYNSMREADIPAIHKILSDSPTWHVCPGTPEGGTYRGMQEVFGVFYQKLMSILIDLRAWPEVFIDGSDVVTALGFYSFRAIKDGPEKRVRFSHTWKITPDNRIDGVWQVCDSYEMREFLKAK